MAKRGQSKYMPHLRNHSSKARIVGSVAANAWDETAALIKANGVGPSATLHVNERGITRTPEEMKTKGKYGGLCNRSCCLRRESYWYNRGSYAYYCEDCANLINNEFRHRDDVENYGSLLVQPPEDVDVVDLSLSDSLAVNGVAHEKPWAIQHSNGQLVYADTEEEACKMQRHFRYVTGLRSDGSTPLWFKELAERYEHLRTLVEIKASR